MRVCLRESAGSRGKSHLMFTTPSQNSSYTHIHTRAHTRTEWKTTDRCGKARSSNPDLRSTNWPNCVSICPFRVLWWLQQLIKAIIVTEKKSEWFQQSSIIYLCWHLVIICISLTCHSHSPGCGQDEEVCVKRLYRMFVWLCVCVSMSQ